MNYDLRVGEQLPKSDSGAFVSVVIPVSEVSSDIAMACEGDSNRDDVSMICLGCCYNYLHKYTYHKEL